MGTTEKTGSAPVPLAERRRHLPVMLAWGAIVLALTVVAIATGFLGLIIIFPLLGHGTWHSYRAIR